MTVHEPGCELKLGVQSSAGAQQPVGGSAARGDVRSEDVDRCCRRGGKPLQVNRRIADGDSMPVHDADDGGNAAVVVEEETGRGSTAQHHRRFETPEVIVGDRSAPSGQEGARHPFGVLGAVDQTRGLIPDLLCRADDQARLAGPRHGERMRCRESLPERRSYAGPGGNLARIDPVPGNEARDHGSVIGQGNFPEQFGRRIRQQRTHARRERAQRPSVGAKLVGSLGVDCHTDDDVGTGIEGCLHGVNSACGVLRQGGNGDDVGIRRDG